MTDRGDNNVFLVIRKRDKIALSRLVRLRSARWRRMGRAQAGGVAFGEHAEYRWIARDEPWSVYVISARSRTKKRRSAQSSSQGSEIVGSHTVVREGARR